MYLSFAIVCYQMALELLEMTGNVWLSLEETAEYLGIGKTALYEMARNKRIPAQKIGKKWVFEKADLDTWVRSSQPINSFFTNLDFNIEDNEQIREPQRDGYLRTYEFFRAGNNRAILQIPVGCGKSGLASLLPLGIAEGRVLIIAPNLTIKDGLFDSMDITNRQKCFWRKAHVLNVDQMISGPLACTLDSGNISSANKSHIVITNIQQIATNPEKWLMQFSEDFFDMVIVDEAHHSAASSWKRVIERFPAAKIVLMTATPFRSDRQNLDGELVYRYSFRAATLKGYIKRLKASYVAPSEIELGFADDKGNKYTLDEIMELKEEEWFSRGVALAPLCNKHIVDNSLGRLEDLRQSGTYHQLIAVACSISHARQISSLYRERGYSAEVIHSNQSDEEQSAILKELRVGNLDCIIQVQMLGEGFDHPKLSVAAIFRPFRSLAPYVQFVGRVMRVIVQNDASHPDNVGHIVTHLGMNLDARLREFQQFENDDQTFWDRVIGGAEPDVPSEVREGRARLRATERVVVHGEIVDSLWEEDFTSVDDKHIIEDLRERLSLLGLDPNQAETIVKNKVKPAIRKGPVIEPFPILPQRELEEARRRVDEEAKRLAKIILNNFRLNEAGKELTYKYKSLNVDGRNNYVSAVMLVNREIGRRLGKERGQASTEDFQKILSARDDLLQFLVKVVQKAKGDYEDK